MWLALLTGAISRNTSKILLPAAAFHHFTKLKPHGKYRNLITHQSPCIITASAPTHQFLSSSSSSQNGEDRTHSSSYDVDVDEDAEQRLSSDHPMSIDMGGVNGDSIPCRTFSRYHNLVNEVGLGSMLTSSLLEDMPQKRPVSPNDIFCNRELKLGAIRAIGFDMDYTLAQYQQPAFDNLAFEGAKRKLVDSLGYPKEVLDLQYDHNVRCFTTYND